ncbi:acyltransferase family protein [Desulfovibrio inopinatus]|uniref:acyltransferase family protein n=1 Tax=Desulfovibrio inopinatus TaxID=102109 RepID=UPI00041AC43E|nr:acyltransferase [Desulfovibrio inopinatus]
MSTRRRIDRVTSHRIDVLKIALVFFVIMIHAEKGLIVYVKDYPPAVWFTASIWGHHLCRVAVPLFFIISSYLFFSTWTFTRDSYVKTVIKKTKTVLFPYLLFNTLLVLSIMAFGKIPYIGNQAYLTDRGIWDLFLGIHGKPINYTLWFLRDLYIFFLAAPLFLGFFRVTKVWGIILVFIFWTQHPAPYLTLDASGVFFFYCGCVLAKKDVDLDGLSQYGTWIVVGYILMLSLGVWLEADSISPEWYYPQHCLELISGVGALWALSRLPWVCNNAILLRAAPFSFFVYLIHEPILSLFIYYSRFIFLPFNPLTDIVYYFGISIITFCTALGTGRLLARYSPNTYALLTGLRRPSTQA